MIERIASPLMHRMCQGGFHMEEQYEVYLASKSAGKVQLIRQGLYCRVICRCQFSAEGVYRLYVQRDNGQENLGVVVPDGDGFYLDRKIPVKRIGEGPLRFVLSSGMPLASGTFYPISPEEPFLYIDRLKNAFLDSENGKIGIRIKESPEAV